MLYFINFVANAAILVFEIAGARLLAPYLGTSTEVWAALIAVILGGMSAGYWIGGVVADKYPSYRMLGILIFASSCAAFIAWGVRDLIPSALVGLTVQASLTGATVVIALILFAPLAVLLGMVSPYVAKLALQNLQTSARVVGRLSAFGAAGSIVGAISTGAYLIAYFSIDQILLGVAVALLILSLIVSFEKYLPKFSVLALILIASVSFSSQQTHGEERVADVATPYNRIWVINNETLFGKSVRMLRTDPFGIQCVMSIKSDGTVDESEPVFWYQRFFAEAAANANHSRMLVLGGCNHSLPRYLQHKYPDAQIDVVEIDPGMTAVAINHFDFDPAMSSLNIFHEDARMYIARTQAQYDYIVMDTFNAALSIPHHLTTQESFEDVKRLLAPDGILAINMLASPRGPGSEFVAAMARTVGTVFPYVRLQYNKNFTATRIQNVMLLASNNPLSQLPQTASSQPIEILESRDLTDGIILTDSYAPVENMLREMAPQLLLQY
ncbi:MAG TPA: fused MFS/spermidine synthase [Candidatus Paceibacterota bacterium]|nr:fused MFS/spermidine synthase [Candidatus Paceibacterota bacterium]